MDHDVIVHIRIQTFPREYLCEQTIYMRSNNREILQVGAPFLGTIVCATRYLKQGEISTHPQDSNEVLANNIFYL